MSSIQTALRALLGPVLLGAVAVAPAQPVAAPSAAASAPAKAVPAHVTVIEDDNARIEEHRVRGVVTRVHVQSKLGGAPAYEIQVVPPGRESMSDRGSQGRRTWSLLRF